MADKRVRSIVQNCLGKSGTLSLKEDVMGVYGNDNPTDRRLKPQLNLIENRPFVRVALVTIRPVGSTQGQNANLQRDLDNANLVYQDECNAWVYPVGSRVVRTNILGANGLLDQDDCSTSHSVSDEEDDLFDLGRNMGADVVCYYITGDVGGFRGCAAHPNNRRGFWVGNTATQWTFVHELTHVIGDNRHVADDPDVPDTRDNLMWPNTGQITNAPPDLETVQCNRITGDQDMERC